jgi:hypothetical protein
MVDQRDAGQCLLFNEVLEPQTIFEGIRPLVSGYIQNTFKIYSEKNNKSSAGKIKE